MSISFAQYEGGFDKIDLQTIFNLNVSVKEGELVAIAGSSGSGKSLLAHGILGVLPYNAKMNGKIYYMNEELTIDKVKKLRGKEIVLVPQSVAYLNPLMKVGLQVRKGRNSTELKKKSESVLARYGLDKDVEQLYPFELSGGMSRRILISTAVIEKAKLVIADEPTPGIHVSTAKRILGHFREIADEGAGVLLITHDLELALEIADRVIIFYAGTTLEEALAKDFDKEETLRHPYTKALWRAMPQHGFHSIKGSQPYAKDVRLGCSFYSRCDMRTEECLQEILYRELRNGYVRCIHAQ